MMATLTAKTADLAGFTKGKEYRAFRAGKGWLISNDDNKRPLYVPEDSKLFEVEEDKR